MQFEKNETFIYKMIYLDHELNPSIFTKKDLILTLIKINFSIF